MGYEIPASFFSDLEGGLPYSPAGSMKWYDHIIDDMLSNPGTSVKATAARLNRSPGTISAICSSDLFKARYAQRRQAYEEALKDRMVAKLTQAADLCLDATIETLNKKRDSIPLPVLTELTKTTLDRLGYGPREAGDRQLSVTISNNVVSAEALAAAREKLKTIEGTSGPPPSPREAGVRQPGTPSDLVAGQGPKDGEED